MLPPDLLVEMHDNPHSERYSSPSNGTRGWPIKKGLIRIGATHVVFRRSNIIAATGKYLLLRVKVEIVGIDPQAAREVSRHINPDRKVASGDSVRGVSRFCLISPPNARPRSSR